jgi:hypothetical protein
MSTYVKSTSYIPTSYHLPPIPSFQAYILSTHTPRSSCLTRIYWIEPQNQSSERGSFTGGGAALSGDWRKVEDVYDPEDLSDLDDGDRKTLERVMNEVLAG